MEQIKHLQWRYATKQFDATKKVPEEHIDWLKQSIQLSASSFGLQPFQVLDVRDEEIRKQLQPASWNQSQIVDASHLFVFCNYAKWDSSIVDSYIANQAKTRGVSEESLEQYAGMMKGFLDKMSPEQFQQWGAKQAYIALGTVMAACGELEVDSCPIEGFESKKYDDILGLGTLNLTSCVVLPIGYRSTDDKYASAAKVRKSVDELFIVR
jgi:nitroreductase